MKIDNQSLQAFAGSMATCLASALPLGEALELSGAKTPSKALRELVLTARERCDQGLPVSEALEPGARLFPRYFIPLIQAGEASGRLVEAFQLLEEHCRRIGPTRLVVRNTWLYPVICVVFGWIVRAGIYVYFRQYAAAGHFLAGTLGGSVLVVTAGGLLYRLELVKRAVDAVLLQLPLVRETEIHQAVILFFGTFRLVYAAGGLGVLTMFDLSWQTVRNEAIRRDLLKVREVLAANGDMGDAFSESALLEVGYKGMIHTGALSGRLDECFDVIANTAAEQLERMLQVFNRIFLRLVVLAVAFSIIETVLICTM